MKFLGVQTVDFSSTRTLFRTNVQMLGSKIYDLAEPTVAQDAATKNYVDTAIAAIPPAEVTTPIDWESGDILVSIDDPTTKLTGAANNFNMWVMGVQVLNIRSDSLAINVPINMATFKIGNMGAPTLPNDAATMAYVDAGDAALLAKVTTLETQLADAMSAISTLQAQVAAL